MKELPVRYYVSIRSPHRSKGRRHVVPAGRAALIGFNPLPSPKQGETDTLVPRSS